MSVIGILGTFSKSVTFQDLVYFTSRVPATSATRVGQSDTSATQVRHERHECNTSEKF